LSTTQTEDRRAAASAESRGVNVSTESRGVKPPPEDC
jgi:hypothetical protein